MKNYGRESVNGDFPCAKLENAKKIAKIWRLWKNPEHILINMFRPTYVPNLVTLAWKMSSGMWKIMDVRVLTGLVCPAARPLGVRQHPGALKGCGVKSIGGIHHKIPWLFPDFPIFKDFPWLFTEFPDFSLTLKNKNFPWLFPDRWQPCNTFTLNTWLLAESDKEGLEYWHVGIDSCLSLIIEVAWFIYRG